MSSRCRGVSQLSLQGSLVLQKRRDVTGSHRQGSTPSSLASSLCLFGEALSFGFGGSQLQLFASWSEFIRGQNSRSLMQMRHQKGRERFIERQVTLAQRRSRSTIGARLLCVCDRWKLSIVLNWGRDAHSTGAPFLSPKKERN